MAYNILEIANTHGGDLAYVKATVEEFAGFTTRTGIKFQPFKYDEIAVPEFYDYETYRKFYFNPEQWGEILALAATTKEIWIDVFDTYSVQIIRENLQRVRGIKFQSSTLNNYALVAELADLDLSRTIVVVNIAAFELEEVDEVIARITEALKPEEVVLQVGFQDYPTDFSDSGLCKIGRVKERFGRRISFADHVDAETEDAIYLPVVAGLLGADFIEKHIRHSTLETHYDRFSSLSVEGYRKFSAAQERYEAALRQPFINDRERNYLTKTLQVPILGRDLTAGRIPSLKDDFVFRRSPARGLNVYEIRDLVAGHHVLGENREAGAVLRHGDFKNAVIATIIACRMKSSRLPKKAILKLGKLSSIELCIQNVLKFRDVHHTVLATSTLEEDAALADHTYSDRVLFQQGHPEDVIARYLEIVDRLGVDVVVRVTGDNPYMSAHILEELLASHFREGADYTTARTAAPGTCPEIINAAALRTIKSHFPAGRHSEYMTFYFLNNPTHFRVNYVDLPESLVRDYRLTLDYPEDLELFSRIEAYLEEEGLEYDLPTLFRYLDENPDLAAINRNCVIKYKTDEALIRELNQATTIPSG